MIRVLRPEGVVETGGDGQALDWLVGQPEAVAGVVELLGDAAVVREAGAAQILDRKPEAHAKGQRGQEPQVEAPARGGGQLVAVEVDAQRAVFAGDADGGGADIGFEGANAVAVAVSEVDFVLPGAQFGVVKIQIEPVETQGVVIGNG